MKRAVTANRHLPSRLVAGVLVALCATLAVPPVAQALELKRGERDGKKLEPPGRETPPSREASPPRAGMSQDRVIKQVESRYKARVLRAEPKRSKDGRLYYEIRLLTEDGLVLNIKVDAESGKTL